MLLIRRLPIIQFITQNPYRKEIFLILFLKLVAMGLIWGFCFAHPLSEQLKKPDLIRHYVK